MGGGLLVGGVGVYRNELDSRPAGRFSTGPVCQPHPCPVYSVKPQAMGTEHFWEVRVRSGTLVLPFTGACCPSHAGAGSASHAVIPRPVQFRGRVGVNDAAAPEGEAGALSPCLSCISEFSGKN